MRVRMFHQDYPEGKLCTTEAEVKAAEAEGAVDAKWKVTGQIPADLKEYFPSKESVAKNKEDIIAKSVPKEGKLCECGCGETTKGGRFFNLGHFNRWKAAQKKKGVKDGDSPQHQSPD